MDKISCTTSLKRNWGLVHRCREKAQKSVALQNLPPWHLSLELMFNRVGSRIRSDRGSGRKGSILTFNLHYLDSNAANVNLQTVLDKESNTPDVRSIVLQAISDHLDWLLPLSISSRYRFILQNIIQTVMCNELSTLCDPGTYDCPLSDEDFASWSRRATFVIETAKVESRSRIALSTTKLMVLLCSRTNTKKQGISLHKCSPCAGLQLRQSSHFWSEMDKDAIDIPSNIMARIFDFPRGVYFLCRTSVRYFLPLRRFHHKRIRNLPQQARDVNHYHRLSQLYVLCLMY